MVKKRCNTHKLQQYKISSVLLLPGHHLGEFFSYSFLPGSPHLEPDTMCLPARKWKKPFPTGAEKLSRDPLLLIRCCVPLSVHPASSWWPFITLLWSSHQPPHLAQGGSDHHLWHSLARQHSLNSSGWEQSELSSLLQPAPVTSSGFPPCFSSQQTTHPFMLVMCAVFPNPNKEFSDPSCRTSWVFHHSALPGEHHIHRWRAQSQRLPPHFRYQLKVQVVSCASGQPSADGSSKTPSLGLINLLD